MSLYYVPNAKSPEHAQILRGLEESSRCVFCPDVLSSLDAPDIVTRTKHWVLTENNVPYPGAEQHFVLVPVRHVERLLDLSDAERHDLWGALSMLEDQRGLDSFSIVIRSGQCERTGGTVRHVHVHLLVAAQAGPVSNVLSFILS